MRLSSLIRKKFHPRLKNRFRKAIKHMRVKKKFHPRLKNRFRKAIKHMRVKTKRTIVSVVESLFLISIILGLLRLLVIEMGYPRPGIPELFVVLLPLNILFFLTILIISCFPLIVDRLIGTKPKESHQNRSLKKATVDSKKDKFQEIGKTGEIKVDEAINNLNIGIKKLFSNFTFYNNSGNSVQIDHILICNKGVYIIETKNWNNCTIDPGSHSDVDSWAITYNRGNVYDCINPIKQNSNHISQLYNKHYSLQKYNLINLIVFTGKAEIKNFRKYSDYITTINYLETKIENKHDIISDEEVRYLTNIFNSIFTKITEEEHSRMINEKRNNKN